MFSRKRYVHDGVSYAYVFALPVHYAGYEIVKFFFVCENKLVFAFAYFLMVNVDWLVYA